MVHLLAGALVALATGAQAVTAPQAPPPSTDVYVAPFSTASGKVAVGKPENISQSPGYDNQPFFAPDGRVLFFTSDRLRTAANAPQMDVFKYDTTSRTLSRVTATDEGEYSPTVTPDGKHLSVIRVETDGTQRLWKFPLNGRDPSVIFENIKPVGYHAWLDANHAAMFVLGQPATLQVADVRSGTPRVVANRIGRSLQKIPGGGVSFVQQQGEGSERKLIVTELTLDGSTPVTRPLIPAVAGSRDAYVAWTPDGTLLMAHDGSLYAWMRGETEWRVVADLGALGLKDVSRIAVSPTGDRIALVAAQ